MEERIQKIISAAGIVSRRAAEELIRDGRVRVNGKVVTELGTKADPDKDHIKVDGKLINPQQPKTYVMLNKPVGYVTTMSDPEGRPVVADLLKGVRVRVYPVGRLDYDTEGLLLLTNDGDFAHLVTHPKHELPKTYLVKIKGVLSDHDVESLEQGVFLKDGKTAPARVRRLRKEEANSWVEITIHEGRKRQVRRMIDHTGRSVIKLKRTRIGTLLLGDLALGAYRHLTSDEVKALVEASQREQAVEIKLPPAAEVRRERAEEKPRMKVARKPWDREIEIIEPLASRKPRKAKAGFQPETTERPERREVRGPRPEGKRPWQEEKRTARRPFRTKPEGAGEGFRPRSGERGEWQGERPIRREARGARTEGKRPWERQGRSERPSFRKKAEGTGGGFRPRADRGDWQQERPERREVRGPRPEGKRPWERQGRSERPSFRGKAEGTGGGFRPRADRGDWQGERPERRDTRGPRPEGKRPWQGAEREGGSAFIQKGRPSWGKGPARTSSFASGKPRSSSPRSSRPRPGKPVTRKGRRD